MTPLELRALHIWIPRELRAARRGQDKTQTEMAKAMGTTPQTVQRLETASMTMSLEWLGQYLAALGMRFEDLAGAEIERQGRQKTAQALRKQAERIEAGED